MTTISNLIDVTSPEHFQSLLSEDLQRVSLINFWAPWAAPCTEMNKVVSELAKKYPKILVLQVEAEEQSDIAESFEIEAVPSFIVLRGHTLLGRIPGADAAALTAAVATHTGTASSLTPLSKTTQSPSAPPTSTDAVKGKEETQEELDTRLRGLMNKSKVVLFMKGNPDEPRCGFSRKTVALLNEQGVEFTHFDILEDESVRQGLKTLNDWPTFPQIIVKGELVGGLDIVTDMVENGEFKELLAAE